MKKKRFLFIIPLLILLTASCSSDDPTMPTGPEHTADLKEVTINIENFKLDNGGTLRSAATEVVEDVKYLTYYIFDESDYLIDSKSYKDQTPPSTLKFNLTKGTFKILIYASNGSLFRIPTPGHSTAVSWTYGVSDLTSFLMRDEITVTIDDKDVTESITLKHFYGRLVIALDDFANIPESVKSIVPIISDGTALENSTETRGYVLAPIGYDETLKSYITETIERPMTPPLIEYSKKQFECYLPLVKNRNQYVSLNQNNPIVLYLYPTNNPEKIRIQGPFTRLEKVQLSIFGYDIEDPTYNSLDNLVFSKTISFDVDLESGQSLKYTGKLFSGDGLSVNIDTDWSETVDEKEL